MKKLVIIFVLVLILTGCTKSGISDELKLKENLGIEELSIEEIIYKLGEMSTSIKDVGASVYDDKLVIRSGSVELKYEMPEEMFYVAVAPYENTTHT
ncbi:membrane lipoprotein lipid attachment site-containing protein [Mycoplasmatota bacterium]|nr:membrane lipoprotein lipid attachment site-containing protein [Mycoplasmatota bacterium]